MAPGVTKAAATTRPAAGPLPSRLLARRPRKGGRRQGAIGYLFLTPALVFFAIFLVVPLAFSFVLSLCSWSGFDLTKIRWIGFSNYTSILRLGSTFVNPVLVNTFVFAVGAVIVTLVMALVIAYFLSRIRGQAVWRMLLFLPAVTTVVAVGNMWKSMYNPTGGLVDALLGIVGFKAADFLGSTSTALYALVVVQVWSTLGIAVLILSAGIKSIPGSYAEAAAIDGATDGQIFRRVTLPLLRPSILFVLITQFIAGLQTFALVVVMTNGGPAKSTDVAGLEMYQQAFAYSHWGVASAMAFVLFVLIFLITLVQLWIGRERKIA